MNKCESENIKLLWESTQCQKKKKKTTATATSAEVLLKTTLKNYKKFWPLGSKYKELRTGSKLLHSAVSTDTLYRQSPQKPTILSPTCEQYLIKSLS